MREETYYVRRLPKNSIRETSTMCNREQTFHEIVAGTFFEFPEEGLKIRPKAALFTTARGDENVYAVLHKEKQQEIECLFFVKFVRSTFYGEIAEVQLCRCLGTTKVKRHYNLVRNNLTGMAHFFECHPENAYDFTIFQ